MASIARFTLLGIFLGFLPNLWPFNFLSFHYQLPTNLTSLTNSFSITQKSYSDRFHAHLVPCLVNLLKEACSLLGLHLGNPLYLNGWGDQNPLGFDLYDWENVCLLFLKLCIPFADNFDWGRKPIFILSCTLSQSRGQDINSKSCQDTGS